MGKFFQAYPGYNPAAVNTEALAQLARVVAPLPAESLAWGEWVEEDEGEVREDIFLIAARDPWFRGQGWAVGLAQGGGYIVPTIAGASKPGRHPARAVAVYFFPGLNGYERQAHPVILRLNDDDCYAESGADLTGEVVAGRIQDLLGAVWLDSWSDAFRGGVA